MWKLAQLLLLLATIGGCASDAKVTTVVTIQLPPEVRGTTLPNVALTFTVAE